jgi:membrane associated rhomboid family serine protease
MATCYRHPGRETGVSCSNCERPICTDCMTSTPVGMRCPECARQRTQVRTMRSMAAEPTVTYVLIALNVLLFIGEQLTRSNGVVTGSTLGSHLATWGVGIGADGSTVGVAGGEFWRLITGGFLHDVSNPLHIGFNMYILWWLGRMLEPGMGHIRFAALYAASLLAGSFGAVLVEPTVPTVGASGAVFGLMGAAFLMQRARGIDPMQSGIGVVIALNLVLQFVIPGVSWGAHVGGLIGGGLAGWAMDHLASRRGTRSLLAPVGICFVVSAISVAGAIMVSTSKAQSVGLAAVLSLVT